MNQDNILISIEDYASKYISNFEFETNWLDGYVAVRPVGIMNDRNYLYDAYNQKNNLTEEYVDKDKKIRDLEARVKELEAILEEEI